MKYWKTTPVEAVQWFRNGDHPDDHSHMVRPDPRSLTQFAPFLSEGEVVRYYRHPEVPGDTTCPLCDEPMHVHGWIDDGSEDGHVVCPGDYVLTMEDGGHFPVKAAIFERDYEQVAWKLVP